MTDTEAPKTEAAEADMVGAEPDPDPLRYGSLPASGGEAVTLSSDYTATHRCRGILVGVAGNVEIDTVDGTTSLVVYLAAGVIHPIAVTKVHMSGTAATGIVLFR